jgi:ATP-dependent DNA helicase Rep
MSQRRSVLEVAQTIALITSLKEKEQDANQVTLSTLHASKGLEWPHVMLVGVVEGSLPFQSDAEDAPAMTTQRVEEERRLMYVGITRAQRSLQVSWSRQRKKGRSQVPAVPSRFIGEMALDHNTAREDPREKLKALRAEFAKRAAAPSSPGAAGQV